MKKFYKLVNYEVSQYITKVIIICFGTIISPLLLLNGALTDYSNLYKRFETIYESSGSIIVFAIYFAAICGICIQSLYSNYSGSKSIYTLITLPMKRESIYFSKLISFFIYFLMFFSAQLISVFISYSLVSSKSAAWEGGKYLMNNGLFLAFLRCGNKYIEENGISRAVEYVDYLSVFWGEGNGKAEKLVSFNHKEENFQMLGLHAVEDYLVAVMLVDNILTFRAYNPQNGLLLAELAVPEFKTAEAALDFIRYTPYVNGNTLSLHIIMQNLLSYPDSMLVKPDYISIVSVKISNGSGADINDDGDGGTGAGGGVDADDDTDADGSVDGCVNADSDFNSSNSHSDSSKSATKNLKINLLHCIDTYNLENRV